MLEQPRVPQPVPPIQQRPRAHIPPPTPVAAGAMLSSPGLASSPAGFCSSAVHTLPPIQTLTQLHPRPPSHNHVLTQNPARPKSYTLGPGENIADEWNAIHAADTPTTDALKKVPRRWRTIKAHGTAVGLPSDADMGNSEVRGGSCCLCIYYMAAGGGGGGGWRVAGQLRGVVAVC